VAVEAGEAVEAGRVAVEVERVVAVAVAEPVVVAGVDLASIDGSIDLDE
jgi:hypothetical protein